MTYSLPPLSYAFDALEPVIDAQTMELHHDKHHQAYVTALNTALEGHPDLAAKSIEMLPQRLGDVPDDIRDAVRNQGGGHANHQLFWKVLKPGGATGPSGCLAKLIDETFGSLDTFKAAFEDAGMKHFGSGWVFLATDPKGEASRSSPRRTRTACCSERQAGTLRQRPVGACVLSQAPQPTDGLPQGVLAGSQLDVRGRAARCHRRRRDGKARRPGDVRAGLPARTIGARHE